MKNHKEGCAVVTTGCNCTLTPWAEVEPMTAAEYFATLDGLRRGEPTPNLDTFRRMMLFDDNAVWRMDQGHIVNLLESAIEMLEKQ
jgi:hypothetical protein